MKMVPAMWFVYRVPTVVTSYNGGEAVALQMLGSSFHESLLAWPIVGDHRRHSPATSRGLQVPQGCPFLSL